MEISNESNNSSKGNDSLCRVCLSSNKKNKCIFSFHMTFGNRNFTGVLEPLQLFGGIEVKYGDGLPSKICDKCIANVRIAHEFRKQCQETDRKLRSLIEQVRNENCENQENRIVTAPLRNSARIAQNRTESCKNAIVVPNIGDKNSSNGADMLSAQPPATFLECYVRNLTKPWMIRAKKLESVEKSEKIQPKLSADKNIAPNRSDRRSRRLMVFRRVTSMENLKKRKERQRRYLKKASRAMNGRSNDERLPDKFPCDRCGERFSEISEFLEHAKSHGLQDKLMPATCEICNKYFRRALTMVRHLNVHKRENPRAVYTVLKKMRNERKTDKLWNLVQENDTTTEMAKSLKDSGHSRKSRSRSDKLLDSPRALGNRDDSEIPSDDRSAIKLINTWIREELEFANEGKSFACDICDKSYVTKNSLILHVSKIHDGSSQCNICQGRCTCADKTGENTHRCGVCEKTFEDETKLAEHMETHSEDKKFKRFLCHICSKTYRKNTGLMFHMRSHTGYKPHVCKYCERAFASNSNRINHERTHTGDRPFVCHFCSAAFAKSCTLKAHITTHTGEANYHCKTCGKSFKRLKYLKEHNFTHTGEKPYACKICGTAYSHSGSLFVHEKKCKARFDDH